MEKECWFLKTLKSTYSSYKNVSLGLKIKPNNQNISSIHYIFFIHICIVTHYIADLTVLFLLWLRVVATYRVLLFSYFEYIIEQIPSDDGTNPLFVDEKWTWGAFHESSDYLPGLKTILLA